MLNSASLSSHTQNSKLSLNTPAALPAELLPNLTFGYRYSYASLLWIKTIAYYGFYLERSNFNYVAQLLKSITELNNYAEHAYYMAAAAIPWSTQSTAISRPLIIKAMINFSGDWRWPYYLGFNAYWFDHDPATAAHYLARAARFSDSPPMISTLAARMQSEASSLDSALLFLESLLKNKQDKAIQRQLLRQAKQIRTEKILRQFESRFSYLPLASRKTEMLKELKTLKSLSLPDGGHIILNEAGVPVSSRSKKRYHVYIPPKKAHELEGINQ